MKFHRFLGFWIFSSIFVAAHSVLSLFLPALRRGELCRSGVGGLARAGFRRCAEKMRWEEPLQPALRRATTTGAEKMRWLRRCREKSVVRIWHCHSPGGGGDLHRCHIGTIARRRGCGRPACHKNKQRKMQNLAKKLFFFESFEKFQKCRQSQKIDFWVPDHMIFDGFSTGSFSIDFGDFHALGYSSRRQHTPLRATKCEKHEKHIETKKIQKFSKSFKLFDKIFFEFLDMSKHDFSWFFMIFIDFSLIFMIFPSCPASSLCACREKNWAKYAEKHENTIRNQKFRKVFKDFEKFRENFFRVPEHDFFMFWSHFHWFSWFSLLVPSLRLPCVHTESKIEQNMQKKHENTIRNQKIRKVFKDFETFRENFFRVPGHGFFMFWSHFHWFSLIFIDFQWFFMVFLRFPFIFQIFRIGMLCLWKPEKKIWEIYLTQKIFLAFFDI